MGGTLRKLYRNTLFRLSLLGAFLFVASLFIALGYIYYATIESELRRVDRANETEIAELQEFYDRAGSAAVRTAILTSAGIALLLGLLSSFFVSRRFARRLRGCGTKFPCNNCPKNTDYGR